jgi:hypothetical protein
MNKDIEFSSCKPGRCEFGEGLGMPEYSCNPKCVYSEDLMKCGHPKSLLLISAETGEPLYCEYCDAISRKNDAEQRESELTDLTASLQAENKRLLEALKETNEEIRSGIESNVELEAEHSVFARELTAKNDALISEIEGRK